MNLGRGFADSERGKTELFKVLKPREEKCLIMTLNSIYLVSETWCTFMNPYKHSVHLKSTTGQQPVLSFVYSLGFTSGYFGGVERPRL